MPTSSSTRRCSQLIAVAFVAALTGCGSGPSEPIGRGRINFVLGNQVSDTVSAVLARALIVDIRDASGNPVTGTPVRFESVVVGLPGSYGYSYVEATVGRLDGGYGGTFAVDSTDATGRVGAMVQLGTKAGPAHVIVRVPAMGYVDTAHFDVLPGNLTAIRFAVRDTALLVGGQLTPVVTGLDRLGNLRSAGAVFYESTSPVLAVKDPVVVTGQSLGRGSVIARTNTFVDTMAVSVVPAFTLAVAYSSGTTRNVATARTDGAALNMMTPFTSSVVLPTMTAAGTATLFYEGDPYSNAQIYVVDAQKSRRAILPANAGIAAAYEPRVTADGKWVYFTGMKPYSSTTTWGTTLWRIHLDGTGLEQLTTGGTGQTSYSMPSPSADGTKVVFVKSGILSVLDLATKAITSLGLSGQLPRFSPDGTRIVYVSGSYPTAIMTANADGTGAVPLTTAGRYYDTYASPDWSPDGQWIVARGGGGLELWRVSDRLLLPIGGSSALFQPSFKPAGS